MRPCKSLEFVHPFWQRVFPSPYIWDIEGTLPQRANVENSKDDLQKSFIHVEFKATLKEGNHQYFSLRKVVQSLLVIRCVSNEELSKFDNTSYTHSSIHTTYKLPKISLLPNTFLCFNDGFSLLLLLSVIGLNCLHCQINCFSRFIFWNHPRMFRFTMTFIFTSVNTFVLMS